jgi:alkylated DNA nucleotide flippase Atl1
MNPFQTSAQTATLVAIMRNMKIGDILTYEQASTLAGFPVGPSGPATQARKVMERDHNIFVYVIRGVGFQRGGGQEMVDSATSMIDGIRRKARRGRSRCELAVRQNLPEREHHMALDYMTRFGLIADTSRAPAAKSNREARDKPETARSAPRYSDLAMIGSKGPQ